MGESNPLAPPGRKRFWFRFVSLGVHPGMTFAERKTCLLLNAVSLFIIGCSVCFAAANLSQGRFDMALHNMAGLAAGSAALVLLARRRMAASLVVLAVFGIPFFSLSGLFFRNGNELNLLNILVLILFILDSLLWRIVLGVLGAGAFLAVEVLHYNYHFDRAAVGSSRYLLNAGIALATFATYVSIFRAIGDDYRRAIEAQNRELEAQRLRLEEADLAQRRLFAVVSHDLRGPVVRLKETLDHLMAGRITPDRFEEVREILRDEVGHAAALTEAILAWSAERLDSPAPLPERVELGAAAGEALALLLPGAREKGIALDDRLPPGAAVRADPGQLRSIFRNLLSNALKFTAPGGRVAVSARRDGARWEIAVADTGSASGSGAAEVRRFLEEGESGSHPVPAPGTAAERGLGLGLRLCRGFVLAHGGSIRAEAAPGGGTVILVTLPAESQAGLIGDRSEPANA